MFSVRGIRRFLRHSRGSGHPGRLSVFSMEILRAEVGALHEVGLLLIISLWDAMVNGLYVFFIRIFSCHVSGQQPASYL